MLYKIVSGTLLFLLLAAAATYGYQRWQWDNKRRNLVNALAEAQEMQQETETAYSRLAIENKDLKASKKELQQVIDDRSEEVLALTNANIRIKNKKIVVEKVKEVIVDKSGDSVEITKKCQEELYNIRQRVSFEHEEDPLRVTGHTLTNPPYAEINLEWLRDLRLELVLTKNEDDTYRVYIDSEKSDVVPTELELQVDPDVLSLNWYQKIGLGTDLAFGKFGGLVNVRAFYDLTPNWYLGPNVTVLYDGMQAKTFFGASVGFYPWK